MKNRPITAHELVFDVDAVRTDDGWQPVVILPSIHDGRVSCEWTRKSLIDVRCASEENAYQIARVFGHVNASRDRTALHELHWLADQGRLHADDLIDRFVSRRASSAPAVST